MNYSDTGFAQPDLEIKQDTKITFINKRTELGIPIWVAFDIHPEHTIYPQFDQARPLGFEPRVEDNTDTFNKPGKWLYRNYYDTV